MLYDETTRTLTLEMKDCTRCDKGTVPTQLPCEKCKGTGNGPRGGKRGCRVCYGMGTRYDHENRVPCEMCHGAYTAAMAETFCDEVPREMFETFPIRVVREHRTNTWNENHLGLGSLWSMQDYGKRWAMSDEEIVAGVRADLVSQGTQAVKIVRDYKQPPVMLVSATGREFSYSYDRRDPVPVCDHIVVVVTRDGAAVRAGWDDAPEKHSTF